MRAAIITSSTLGYKHLAEDGSGPVIKRMLEKVGFQIEFMRALPEDREVLRPVMERLIDQGFVDLIVTTGGIGLAESDAIPEATLDVIERALPGIPEAMRTYSMRYSKRAMLNRSVAGIRGKSLIVNLPGSPKRVNECLEYILPEIVYTVEVLTGKTDEARE